MKEKNTKAMIAVVAAVAFIVGIALATLYHSMSSRPKESAQTQESTQAKESAQTDEEMIAYIKSQLGIPADLDTEDVINIDSPSYWEAGDMWLVNCEFYHEDKLVAAAMVDKETGDLARNIMMYTDDSETIQQVSLLQALTLGDYYGSLKVKELKELGDTGIGTFNAVNGELIMLDGEVYRAGGDGKVEVVEEDETIPFANVTFFDYDETVTLTDIADINQLQDSLNEMVAKYGQNDFYMVKVEGEFSEMNVRSERPQEEPYRPLAKVLETDQTFFDYTNIKGCVVGLYCPEYMNSLNATGWHFHFISEDKKSGGHVLGLKADTLQASIDPTKGFSMTLPGDEFFENLDLTVDQREDIDKVEKNQ